VLISSSSSLLISSNAYANDNPAVSTCLAPTDGGHRTAGRPILRQKADRSVFFLRQVKKIVVIRPAGGPEGAAIF